MWDMAPFTLQPRSTITKGYHSQDQPKAKMQFILIPNPISNHNPNHYPNLSLTLALFGLMPLWSNELL